MGVENWYVMLVKYYAIWFYAMLRYTMKYVTSRAHMSYIETFPKAS